MTTETTPPRLPVRHLSHQWFGEDVAPYEWSDVRLNERHTTSYQNEYAEENGYLIHYYGVATKDDLMREVHSMADCSVRRGAGRPRR